MYAGSMQNCGVSMGEKKDNSTYKLKVSLRQRLLKRIDAPIILETFGGYGKLYDALYYPYPAGCVMEKDAEKIDRLAEQRPTWAVYECDSIAAIAGGVGAHLLVNYLDVDAYGEPWPVIDAWFSSSRPRSMEMAIVVTDGLRQPLSMGKDWKVSSMADMVERYGNRNLHANYLEICRELLAEKAAQAGYKITAWAGYYCGHSQQMTHYGAILKRD